MCASTRQQFGKNAHSGVMVWCPQTFSHITFLAYLWWYLLILVMCNECTQWVSQVLHTHKLSSDLYPSDINRQPCSRIFNEHYHQSVIQAEKRMWAPLFNNAKTFLATVTSTKCFLYADITEEQMLVLFTLSCRWQTCQRMQFGIHCCLTELVPHCSFSLPWGRTVQNLDATSSMLHIWNEVLV